MNKAMTALVTIESVTLFVLGAWMVSNGAPKFAEDAEQATVPETCDPVDLAICELKLFTQEDYTRMYQESSAAYLEAANQAQALAKECSAMLVKVLDRLEETGGKP
jgi:hypothetical protein